MVRDKKNQGNPAPKGFEITPDLTFSINRNIIRIQRDFDKSLLSLEENC